MRGARCRVRGARCAVRGARCECGVRVPVPGGSIAARAACRSAQCRSAAVPKCRKCRSAAVPKCRSAVVPQCRSAAVPRCRGAGLAPELGPVPYLVSLRCSLAVPNSANRAGVGAGRGSEFHHWPEPVCSCRAANARSAADGRGPWSVVVSGYVAWGTSPLTDARHSSPARLRTEADRRSLARIQDWVPQTRPDRGGREEPTAGSPHRQGLNCRGLNRRLLNCRFLNCR